MIALIIIKTIILLLLCLVASYTDIKQSTIPNRLVFVAGITGLVLNIIGWTFIDATGIRIQLINIGLVWLISILLYALQIWAGGDAKLMMAIALLFPCELYFNGFYYSLPSLIHILVFAFIISYCFLIVDSIYYAVKLKHVLSFAKLKTVIINVLQNWVACVAYIVLVDTSLLTFFPFLATSSWIIIVVNICVVLIVSGIKVLVNRFAIIAVVFIDLVLKLVLNQPIANRFMLMNFGITVLLIILRCFINEYDYKDINVSQLKKGMILSFGTSLLFIDSKVDGLPSQSTENLRSRLTEDEVTAVKKWSKTKAGSETISIVRKIPFAIFISVGTFLTLLLGVFYGN